MSRARVTLGEIGENLACEELVRRGYEILVRRWRLRGGEIDIIALDGRSVVFVEVKTRAGAEYGTGADAITWQKRRRMVGLAAHFMARERLLDRAVRFDVVSIALADDGPRIEVYQGAFDATT
ncbi:MAG: YraN family protein [Acidobacteria bacterium]|nr:YraN family protein [Acidobacteriota bacterium]